MKRRGLLDPDALTLPPGPLDEALSLLVHATFPLQPEKIRALQHRLGGNGTPPVSPTAAAARAGLSTRRVQRYERQARQLARRVPAPTSLRRALRLLGGRVLWAGEATAAMQKADVTRGRLDPETVLLAAAWFGLPVPTRTHRLADGSRLLVPTSRAGNMYGQLRMLCRARGIASIRELRRETGLESEKLRALIEDDPRLRRHAGWAWTVPDLGRNIIRHGIDRMLAIGEQPVASLHEGLHRARPGRTFPPADVLAAYVADQPQYQLAGEMVSRRRGTRVRRVGTDATLARALRRGRELSMPQLVQTLVEDGYGAGGAKHIVRTAPVLRRVGYNRYRLRRG